METRSDTKIQDNPFFPNLTGLRFVGAFMVFIFHALSLGREIWSGFTDTALFRIILTITGKGHLGVMLFFVLSGFLITYLMLHENQRKGKISLSNFIARRILRIWPLYFLIVGFGFFIFPHLPFGLTTVHELWRYMLFLSNIDEIILGMKDSINFLTATWSVSIEEQFYLSWAVLIGIFGFRKKQTFRIFFVAVIILVLTFRFLNLGNDRVLYFHTFSVISDLAVGGILALLAFSGKIQPLMKNLPKWKILLVYVAGIAITLLEAKLFTGKLFVFQRVIIAVFFAFVIAEQVYAENSFFKIDSVPGLKRSGEFTYGFYMFHCIFIYYWQQIFLQAGWTTSVWFFMLYLILSFASTYIMSWLSFTYFEKPILTMKKYFR